MDNVAPILACDKALMLQHLTLLFGRALEGRIEITAIKAADRAEHIAPRTHYFNVDELEEAAEWAASVNGEHMWNVYVGAALRRPDVFPGKAADDGDFLTTYAVWADADDDVQVSTARDAYQRLSITPAMVVVTGRLPDRRAQFWWPLETPIADIAVLRATVRGIADVLGTDHGVLTGKQLMRLAGTLAWPKPNKPGRVLEHTEVNCPPASQREFTLEQLHRAFPPVERGEGMSVGTDIEIARSGALGLDEKVMDGRERYAFNLVRAHLHELIGTTGCEPTADELYRSVGPIYFKKADQVRPGRGPEFLKAKCAEALRAFENGQIPFMRTLDEAVLSYAERETVGRPFEESEPDSVGAENAHTDDDLFEVLSIAQIKALPQTQWLIKDTIPNAGLGFLYGPPGSYKSFVCYDLALTLAYLQPVWIERPIKGEGAVLYIANEGASGAQKRITAWQRKHGFETDSDGFHLIRKSMSFMNPEDVEKLERTVAAHVAIHGPVRLIFVDTVSRVLPGADENLQKDMTIFVAACDLLRERFEATVIGVHHTNKNGDMRGSTVFLGQGDFVFRVDKDDGHKGGVLTCEKQKDAEDGWKVTFDVEAAEWIPTGHIEAVTSLTVAWGGEPKADEPSKWPHRDVLHQFQRDIQAAFQSGSPFSMAPQTKNIGRYAPARLAAAHKVRSEVVKDVLETWLDNGVIEVLEASSHSKVKGLQVSKWLD